MEIRARALTGSHPAPGRFGLPVARRPAVRKLDFAVSDGEVVALCGENASGKTTTLRLLAGLLTPDSGEALLDGRRAADAEARRRLGFAGEQDHFPPGLPVGVLLRYAGALAGLPRKDSRREAQRAAESLGIEAQLDAPAGRCSRGVRRRISLAQALLGRPAGLILDEPLTGLDPVARIRAIGAIHDAARSGAAVLLSLHDAAAVEALADRLILLVDGAVAGEGKPSGFREAAAGRERQQPPLPTVGEIGGPGLAGDWLAIALGRASRDRR